jgi:hypothetical protein
MKLYDGGAIILIGAMLAIFYGAHKEEQKVQAKTVQVEQMPETDKK